MSCSSEESLLLTGKKEKSLSGLLPLLQKLSSALKKGPLKSWGGRQRQINTVSFTT